MRAEAKKALKGCVGFDAESSARINIDALTRANAAWGKMLLEAASCRAESVLTSQGGHELQQDLDDERSTLLSSLSGDDRQGHATQSDEAVGTQKQLKDEMSADLVDAGKAEEDCNTNHAALIAAEKRRSPVQQSNRDQRIHG